MVEEELAELITWHENTTDLVRNYEYLVRLKLKREPAFNNCYYFYYRKIWNTFAAMRTNSILGQDQQLRLRV